MSDMYEQLKMDVADPMPEDKFDSSEPYNEQEEDISGLNKMDLSYMAISGTDWTADTIVNQIRKGNILLSPYFQRRDAWSPKNEKPLYRVSFPRTSYSTNHSG